MNIATTTTTTSIERLPLASIQVCEAYQRTVIRSRVNAIKRKFDPDACGHPTCGRRADGSTWAVDGQQRKQALQELGFTHYDCEVFASAGSQHEAKIFRLKNAGRTGVTRSTIFRAALHEGDPDTVSVAAAIERSGFRISYAGGGKTEYPSIRALASMEEVYAMGGPKLICDTLGVIDRAWHGDVDALRGYITTGVAWFLSHATPTPDVNRLVTALKTVQPMTLLRLADDSNKLLGGSRKVVVAKVIETRYNQRLKKRRCRMTAINPDGEL